MIQSSLLLESERYNFIPYLTLPAIVFFFLHHDGLSSLVLSFFMSFLSSAFSSLPILSLFFIYFLCLLIVFFVKSFFFFKSSLVFFILVFTISLLAPYLADLSHNFSTNDFSFITSLLYVLKATTTLVLSLLLFPVFKKYLQVNSEF